MKKWLVIGMLALSGMAHASTDANKIRYVNGTVKVNRSWFVKAADGSYGSKYDTVCKANVRIPLFENVIPKAIKPEDIKVYECVTETNTKKPVRLAVWGSVAIMSSPADNGSLETQLGFSGSYAFTQTPSKSKNGSFAMFSTKDLGLKSGTLLLPATPQSYEKPEEVYQDTFFAVTLSYER